MTKPDDLVKKLAAIEARVEKATAGPWEYLTDDEGSSMGWVTSQSSDCPPHGNELFDVNGDSAEQAHNAEFVAHAREDVPWLAKHLRQCRREAFEEAAKMIDAEFERIMSKQTANAVHGTFEDGVNANLRMVAVMLPELAESIRARALQGK